MTSDERALLIAAARLLQLMAWELWAGAQHDPDLDALTAALKRVEEAKPRC